MQNRLQRTRVVRRPPGWGGVVGAVTCYCLSLTPSLLPRSWELQSVAAGVTAAVGYAIGAVIGWACRYFGVRPSSQVRLWSWIALGVLGLGAVIWVTVHSVTWEDGLRRLMGMYPHVVWWQWMLVPVASAVLCALLVVLARSIRLGTRSIARGLNRLIPARLAMAAAAVLAVVIIVGIVQGFLVRGVLHVAENAASLANGSTSAGIVRPELPTLSGGPQSLETWESLGSKGRDFVGQAPSSAQIAAFDHKPAMNPIRVYVGLKSASTLTERANLAVAELDRTGAFKRKVLVVFATTGSGWINENLAKPLEYMYDGDSALVAIQYSYLPSWVSFLTEDEASNAGQALFDAVYAHWSALPAAGRPMLLVSGESLGSYATEEAFDGHVSDLLARSQGAVLIGPTPDNPVWQEVTYHRDAGSPIWQPIYQDGIDIRFAHRPAALDTSASAWASPRVVYLQHGSDPVTWWQPELIYDHPQWLNAPRAPDVSPAFSWYPFITFWQVTCDLAGAAGVPDGYGHNFGQIPVAAWAAVTQPPGWTAADTTRLEALLHAEAQAA